MAVPNLATEYVWEAEKRVAYKVSKVEMKLPAYGCA